jgi:hypothetical protein
MLAHQLGFPWPKEVGYGPWDWESLDLYRFAAPANRIIHHPLHSIRKSSAGWCVNAGQSLLGGSVVENSGGVLELAVCKEIQNRSLLEVVPYSELKTRAYNSPLLEARRVFAWASSGRSERMPSQFFSSWL